MPKALVRVVYLGLLGVALLAVWTAWVLRAPAASPAAGPTAEAAERLELDVKSDYSRIKVYKDGNVRSLIFVRDSGEEVVESMLDLKRPHNLLIDYTKFMFMSYAFRPKPEKVLIVGLGGGSMVHYLKHHDPSVEVDVVEIDPVVAQLADRYFGIRTEGNVEIIVKDAFEYFKTTNEKYDVIYMDAFLKPQEGTDSTGVPLRLKTVQFFKEIQAKLKPEGVVVFNLNPHFELDADLRAIEEAFPQSYVFRLPRRGGVVAVGSTSQERIEPKRLRDRGVVLDRHFRASFSFEFMASHLDPETQGKR